MTGVVDAEEAGDKEVRTHEVLADDVPDEYLDKDQKNTKECSAFFSRVDQQNLSFLKVPRFLHSPARAGGWLRNEACLSKHRASPQSTLARERCDYGNLQATDRRARQVTQA